MFRNVYFQRIPVLSFILLFVLIGCGPSAEDIADEVAQELQDEAEKQLEDAWDSFTGWVQEEATAFWDDLSETASSYWDEAQDWGNEKWEDGKEWLGLETPEMVGEVAFAQTQLDHETIKTAFVAAYSEYKLWQNLGEPDGPVSVYAEDALIQYFEKDEERSAIVMVDNPSASSHTAYAIPREWLVMYEALGGVEIAGIPISKPENFNLPWQGKRQEFLTGETSEQYGLLKAIGESSIYVIPPRFYQAYLDQNGLSRLGYPVSNMPLDPNAGNSAWRVQHNIDTETTKLLDIWLSQPYRVQIFEKGSLWHNVDSDEFEVVEKSGLIGGETKLSGEVASVFVNRYQLIEFSNVNACYKETVRHMANATNGDFGEEVLRDLAFLPLESTLNALSLGASSWSAKIALGNAKYFLGVVKEDTFAEANKTFVAGMVVDAFYEKAVGDYLAAPLSAFTLTSAELQYQSLQDDRVSREIHLIADYGPQKWNSQLDMDATIVYDPFTGVVSGVIQSESVNCQASTYVYQFRLTDNPEYETGSFLHRGELLIYDLATAQEMR